MKENKLNAEYIKYNYLLDEMIDNLTKSIDNINNVVIGQDELVACLEKENNPKFTGFIEQLKKTTEQYHIQKKVLEHRLECANKIKFMTTVSKETNFILSMLLETLGVANKDAKTIKERVNNKEELEELNINYIA